MSASLLPRLTPAEILSWSNGKAHKHLLLCLKPATGHVPIQQNLLEATAE